MLTCVKFKVIGERILVSLSLFLALYLFTTFHPIANHNNNNKKKEQETKINFIHLNGVQ